MSAYWLLFFCTTLMAGNPAHPAGDFSPEQAAPLADNSAAGADRVAQFVFYPGR